MLWISSNDVYSDEGTVLAAAASVREKGLCLLLFGLSRKLEKAVETPVIKMYGVQNKELYI